MARGGHHWDTVEYGVLPVVHLEPIRTVNSTLLNSLRVLNQRMVLRIHAMLTQLGFSVVYVFTFLVSRFLLHYP